MTGLRSSGLFDSERVLLRLVHITGLEGLARGLDIFLKTHGLFAM